MKRILLFVISFFFLFLAQASDINFRRLGVKDGLSQINILSVYQDETGVMWFGSSEGLNRYNGNTIDIFRPSQNNDGLTNNEINSIFGNKKGSMYLHSVHDLVKFDLNKRTFTCISRNNVCGISFHNDTLWIATKYAIQYYIESDKQLHFFCSINKKFTPAAAIYVCDNNYIWVTTKSGLIKISKKKPKQQQLIAAIHGGNCFYKDSKRNLWIGSSKDGLYRISPANKIIHFYNKNGANSLSNNRVRTIAEDATGAIWVGTFYGLNRYNPKQNYWTNYITEDNNPYGLSHTSIFALYKDMQGTMWVGTYFGGVNYFNPLTDVGHFYGSGLGGNESLSFPFVGKMVEDERRNLWICTEGGGLNCLNRSTRKFTRYLHQEGNKSTISHNNLKCIYYNKARRRLYIGTHTGGLSIFDLDKKSFRTLKHNAQSSFSLPNDIVNDIQEYKDGLAILTQGGMCILDMDKETFKPFSTRSDINRLLRGELRYETFLIDRSNTLWLANSEGGLVSVNLLTNRINRYLFDANNKSSIGKFKVMSILQDTKGDLYFGTIGSGLFKYLPKTNSFKKYSTENKELPGDYCYYIKESPIFNHLILLHNKGISLFDRQSGTVKCSYNFFQLGFNQGSSIYVTRDGDSYVGGVNGLVSFNERKLRFINSNYRLYFDKLFINNKEAFLNSNQVSLNHDQNNIIIEFSTSNYAQGEDVMYEYRLKGFDRDWIAATSRKIAYTNLNPGKYTLMIREANNENGTVHCISLDMVIAPPFYASLFAYFIYVLLFGGLMYFIIRFKTRQAKLEASLEYERKEKLRIEELNQVKLRFFTNISHEFRTPLTLIIGQIEYLLQLNKFNSTIYNRILRIYKNAWHMRELVSELLDFRKQEQEYLKLQVECRDFVFFTKEIYLCFYEYASKRHINYQFEPEVEHIDVWFDPVQLQKVIFNLLSNAFKHTSEYGTITITICVIDSRVAVSIKDDGDGIPKDSLNRIFECFYQSDNQSSPLSLSTGIGLALTKGIVELHKGHIDVESVLGKGSLFTVTLLLGRDHFSTEEIQSEEVGKSSIIQEEDNKVEISTLDQKYTILIVEDNEEILTMLVDMFSPLYQVHIAHNGREGLQQVKLLHPDIVLSDVMMPEMSGKEMCYKIKNSVELSHIPVVLLTAQTSIEQTIEGYMFGADDYVTKPFHIKVLISRCNNLIKSRKILMERFGAKDSKTIVADAVNELDRALIDKAITIIKANFESPEFDMNMLAAELGMGRSKLYLKIKEVTGLTPNEFTLKVKLDEGMYLLTHNPELNISEISYRLGFSSARYFSKCFKSFYGVTPQQIKNPA